MDDPHQIAKELGRRMRNARVNVFGDRSLGLVAQRLSVDRSVISRWERDERTLSVTDFVRFAHAIGVAPEKLLAGIAPSLPEQQVLPLSGLDAPAATVVRRLVDLLREHSKREPRDRAHSRKRAS